MYNYFLILEQCCSVVIIFSLTGSWWLVTQGFLLRTGDCIRLGSGSPDFTAL